MPIDPICGMNVDKSTNLKLTVGNETYYFCSRHCLEKFAAIKGVNNKEAATCSSCCTPPSANAKWYKNKFIITASILLILAGLSYFIPFLEPFRTHLWMYFKAIWLAVVIGIILGGIIDYFVPRQYVSKILSGSSKKTIFYSVLLGFLTSACSHGILALSIELYKKGASIPAVISFLLASPWANLPFTVLMFGFFGLKALYIIISAIIIAITTGLIFQILEKNKMIEENKNIVSIDENFSIREDIKKRMREYRFSVKQLKADFYGIFSGSVALGNMILWWVLIGVGIASLTGAYIPHNIFHKYMGPSATGIFMTLIFATLLEICSEGTAPVAFEIFRQTGALGNSFIFLMAGVVTDYTEIGLLWSNIGRKTAIWLPIITVPQVILFGILANMLF